MIEKNDVTMPHVIKHVSSDNSTSTINAKISKSNNNTQRKKVKIQVKSLGYQILSENETIIQIIFTKLNRGEWIKYFKLQKKFSLLLLGIISIAIALVIIFDVSIAALLAVRIMVFMFLVYLFINCNYDIFKRGIQSFVFWYKIIHSFIACLAYVILLNSSQELAAKNESINSIDTAADIILALDIVLFVSIASLSDGYPNDCKMMKVIKYGMFALAILVITYQWCAIYFEWNQRVENYNKQFTLHIGKIGYNDSFSYKTMALSSFSKVILFLGVQLYRHIKHPNRLNTIATWIEIKQSDYMQHELQPMGDDNNVDSSNQVDPDFHKKILLLRKWYLQHKKSMFFITFSEVLLHTKKERYMNSSILEIIEKNENGQ